MNRFLISVGDFEGTIVSFHYSGLVFNNFVIAVLFFFIVAAGPVFAGPPFLTDDPEPVDFKGWEVYIATQGGHNQEETSLTLPHFEVNYGLVRNVQIHLIVPLEYVNPKGLQSKYGLSDIEVGGKWRFIQETDDIPQAGTFPIVLFPTGDKDKGLGGGEVQAFLPIWLQKSFDHFKTYGGAGYWINPGSGNKDYWFFGWQVERELSGYVSLGAEIFHTTPSEEHGDNSTGMNIGAIININDMHHVLLSTGREFSRRANVVFYSAYQLTL